MVEASAPGKAILFGEHSVVYGYPALSMAIDARLRVRPGTIKPRHPEPFIPAVFAEVGVDDFPIEVDSSIPPSAGLGSSAALCVALTGLLMDEADPWTVARNAFHAERAAQGLGSPNDTHVSALGGFLKAGPAGDHILKAGGQEWHLSQITLPPLELVVIPTGVKGVTRKMVNKVKSRITGSDDERLRRLGKIVPEAEDALENDDLAVVGELMNEAHRLLTRIGAGHPALDTLHDRYMRKCLGLKLTGAGGGGCLIAVAEDAQAFCEVVKADGVPASIVKTSGDGLLRG